MSTITTVRLEDGVTRLEGFEGTITLARATLLVEGYAAFEINAIVKEAKALGILEATSAGGGNGFNEKFFDALVDAPFESEEELLEYLATEGTENTLRQKGWYIRIAKVAADIHSKYNES